MGGGRKRCAYSDLKFVGVEFLLDGRESPLLSKLGGKKQTNTKGEETRDDEDDGLRGPAGRRLNYSLDSPNPPANRAAPERGNAGG